MTKKTYSFILQGESVDGEFLSVELYVKDKDNFNDALEFAKNEAKSILEIVDGGHIDIMAMDTDTFFADVEV